METVYRAFDGKEFKDVDFPFNEELFEELMNRIFYLVRQEKKICNY